MANLEGLNGVNRQPSHGQKFNRRPSKSGIFTVNRQRKVQLSLAVKHFQGLSNLTISVSRRTAGSQTDRITGTTSFHVPKYSHCTVLSSN